MQAILVNLFAIYVIILVHELGHALAAKRYGVKVVEVSVGFGRTLFSFIADNTIFSLRLLPLGGFMASSQEDLNKLSRWRNIKVSLAGPVANLVLCLILVPILVGFGIVPKKIESWLWFEQLLAMLLLTALGFLVLVPICLGVILNIVLHPIETITGGSTGFISTITDSQIASGFPQLNAFATTALTTFLFSLLLGAANLAPISVLDGGKITETLLKNKPRVLVVWEWATHTVLIALLAIIILSDIFELFR